MATTLRKRKRKGLFRDDKGQLWVLIHLDNPKEDLLEWARVTINDEHSYTLTYDEYFKEPEE